MMKMYLTGALAIVAILLIVGYLIQKKRKKSLPVNLYFEALRNENMGLYEVAEKGYRAALEEAVKYRFHDDLRHKIEEKIRLMQTVITYQQSISFASFNHTEAVGLK